MADGLFVRSGLFYVLPQVSLEPLKGLFRARLITFQVDKGLLPPARANMLRSWVHSGFNVHRCRRVQPHEREDMQRLAQYIMRNPFALEKMQFNNPDEKEGFRLISEPEVQADGCVIYRSGMNPKIRRNFEIFTPCDFILLRSASYGGQVAACPMPRLACPPKL